MKYLPYLVALGTFSPLACLAQGPGAPPPLSNPAPLTPPAPPVNAAPMVPPVPPAPLKPPHGRNRSGVFLGVEVSRVPAVLSEQLNLPEGFGVLVEYVVPGSAADTAGVKAHDILKMINDQIITGSEQLSVLVRSFPDGQAVTLVVLHKGQETKLTATLHLRAAPDADRDDESQHRRRRVERWDGPDGSFSFDFNGFPNADSMEQLQKELSRNRVRIEAETKRALDQAKRSLDEAQQQTARAAGSRWDFDRTHVLLRDATGRIELRVAHGKRSLKVRDPQGKVIFDGPIDTPEQRRTIPADVLPQVEALEKERETVFTLHDGNDGDAADDRDGAF